MKRFVQIARALVVLVPFLSLLPLAWMVSDWIEVSRVISGPASAATVRGFDWVLWQEQNGVVTASYVFPRGPAAEAGILQGDVFYTLEYQQYFNAEDLMRAIDGIPPGSIRVYQVQRGDSIADVPVRFTRYPTFLYPLSTTLWYFSIWGFMLGAFIHVLGLSIAGPLALRSRQAQFSLLLILISALWIFGNTLRLLTVQFVGPPATGGTYDEIFQGVTLVGLVGWIGFPALLLRNVLGEARLTGTGRIGRIRYVLYLPVVVLGAAAFVTTLRDGFGPLTLDGLIAPILFYVCCYVAVAAALVLALRLLQPSESKALLAGWNQWGSAVTLVLAVLAALFILDVVPIMGAITDTVAGWLIVAVQLLAVAPVILVSLATLQYGKVDQVLSRALTYLTVLGSIFFLFVGGLSLVDPYLVRVGASRHVIAGLYVVLLLILFDRVGRRLHVYASTFFATDRQRTRQALSRFQEHMRTLLDHDALAQQTVQVVGETFGARSAILYLFPAGFPGPWIASPYHPEPPYLTERVVARLWPHMYREGRIWASNPELNESSLPRELAELLQARAAALVVPIMGDGAPTGLLVLGHRRQRGAVYNLDDIDQLRSLSGQLALAVERLNLVEREKALVRESAEAQLVALRAQINPHFLFNALNTIIALIEERPEEAEATVEHLAAIFRHILHAGGQPFVTMEEEFALVRHYLGIEQARFGSGLQVDQQLEPALRACPVPAFAVQTLVENAVKHGLEKRRHRGQLEIACRQREDGLAEVVVADTGVGIPALFGQGESVTDQSFFGIGLRNVAARLEQLYGRTDLLRITSAPDKGTTVRLLLSFNPAAAPDGNGHPRAHPAPKQTSS